MNNNYTTNEIIELVSSGSQYGIMKSIITGTQRRVKDNSFIEHVKNNVNNDETILNLPIKYVAVASLDILGIEKYCGDNKIIKDIIKSKMNF